MAIRQERRGLTVVAHKPFKKLRRRRSRGVCLPLVDLPPPCAMPPGGLQEATAGHSSGQGLL